ncbi:MAG TPA: hypothetical protein DD417_08080 [Elusimicrobia bacterium]|nr:hypothetical protein [Elusimicrobiota bacterium]
MSLANPVCARRPQLTCSRALSVTTMYFCTMAIKATPTVVMIRMASTVSRRMDPPWDLPLRAVRPLRPIWT